MTVAASFAVSVGALTGPAAAATSSYEAADELGLLPTLLLFIGGPIGLFVLIWLLVVAGRLSRRSRHENDLSWYREMNDDDDVDQAKPELPQREPRAQLADSATAQPEPVGEPSGSTRVTPTA